MVKILLNLSLSIFELKDVPFFLLKKNLFFSNEFRSFEKKTCELIEHLVKNQSIESCREMLNSFETRH